MSEKNGKDGGGRFGKCGAKTRSGKPCANYAVSENGRCRMHGGFAIRGPKHWKWKDGKTSRWMPKFMDEVFRERLSDEELLSVDEEIKAERALRNYAMDIMRQMEEEPLPPGLKEALKKAGALRRWHEKAEQANANLARLKALRQDMITRRHAAITPHEFRAVYALMMDAVRAEVGDDTVLQRIDDKIRELAVADRHVR